MSNHDMARMYINKHRLLGVKCNFVLFCIKVRG